jgi:hypothetical protein
MKLRQHDDTPAMLQQGDQGTQWLLVHTITIDLFIY